MPPLDELLPAFDKTASDYHPHRRVLRRVTVSGDRPFHRSSAVA